MRHPFSHYKPMGIFSDAQGQLTPQSVVQSGQNSNSSELKCMSSLPASMKRIGWKLAEKKRRHLFPIITLWELSVAMETRVLIWSGPKPNAAFPPTHWCFRINLVVIGPLVAEIFMFEIVKDGRRRRTTDDGRTPGHGYTISSPTSLLLSWAKNWGADRLSYPRRLTGAFVVMRFYI